MKWDVKIDDPIDCFDPKLSYEITKYRPINKTDGLDFNPEWFREDAIHKLNTGKYSGLRIGSKSHVEFWKERLNRCIEGYEVNGYRITGDNYFWLNFYRLKQAKDKNVKAKASSGRKLSFPFFFVYQYEYFHYLEICEIIGKDVGLLKSRGIGFSEVAASLCARPFITTPDFRIVASAFSEKHLKPLLSKIWSQLDWLSLETETAFKRVRMVSNTSMHKKASLKDKDGIEFGHNSEIEGIVADSAEKIRGDRAERLFYEEAGADKIFEQKWVQGEALINVLGEKIGARIGWGTGGTTGTSLEGIKNMILNPDSFNVLKYRHNFTPDRSYIETGMFIPAYITLLDAMDSRGWCDPELGLKHYNKERENKASNPKNLLMYQSEYCYTIEEALAQQGDNVFPREELAEQKAQIEIYKTTPQPHTGWLTWVIDEKGDKSNSVKWRNDPNGKISILEHPIRTEDGTEYKNLYVGGIDSIDIGTKDSSDPNSNKVSDFCIVIKKRVFGQSNPMYVAMYKERPKDPRDAYEMAAKLLTYYGCKAVLESTRTAIITHFRNQKYTDLLMKRPRSTMPDVSKGNTNMIGTPATLKVIAHYRELVYDFVIDYSYTIGFIEMIDQLLNYSDEMKKKFDIVAALGIERCPTL